MVESPSGGVSPRQTDDRQLTGWKEIASYFGKGVRTVQRWEAELSMPVHRLKTGRGETVYAFVSELAAWRRHLDVHRPAPGWDRDDTEPGADGGSAAAGLPVAGEAPVSHGQTTGGAGSQGRRVGAPVSGRRWRLVRIAVAAALVALVTVVAWWTLPGPSTPDPPRNGDVRVRPGSDGAFSQPSSHAVDLDTLYVLDSEGRRLWSRRFEGQLEAGMYGDRSRHRDRPPLVAIEDFDGDGEREVVILTRYSDTSHPGRLYGFNARGEPRFELPVLQHSVRFGDQQYGPPWLAHNLFVTGRSGNRELWVVWVHGSGEFPCLLQRVSHRGVVESEYWNAGYIEFVMEATLGGRPAVLVGATDNGHPGASLAVFDAAEVRGSAPAKSHEKTCLDCPPGQPRAFFLFPRVEITRVFRGFPPVVDARVGQEGDLRVFVAHLGLTPWNTLCGGTVVYDFSPDLVPERAEFSAEYLASHQLMERVGRITHPFGEDDLQQAWPVLIWKGGTDFVPVTGRTVK